MTDTLRDQIAEAVWLRQRHEAFVQIAKAGCGPIDVPIIPIPLWAYQMADTVIAALGLRRETVELLHRHVTDWTTDE